MSRTPTEGLRARLERLPPFLAYAICTVYERGRARHISLKELAQRTGLTKWQVVSISRRLSWKGVAVERMVAFLEACDIDICRLRETARRIRRHKNRHNPFYHLSPDKYRAFVRRIEKYKALCQTKS